MRMLLKLAETTGHSYSTTKFSATGVGVGMRRLFAANAPGGLGLAGEVAAGWYVAEAEGSAGFGASSAQPWDLAHGVLRDGLGLQPSQILAAEPDLEQGWTWPPNPENERFAAGSLLRSCVPDQQKGPPFDMGDSFGWHLDDRHSGLRLARQAVGAASRVITIVHLDTGYDQGHSALPDNLDLARARNFVERGEAGPNTNAVDQTPETGLLKNRGHGTGTIGILAGGDASGLVSVSGLQPSSFGPIGGAPEATVVPVRIANSVVNFWTSTVAEGINYAREIGADVLSMSMGGLPSQAWADAVNAAYDAGVVLVCAAGNSFGGLPTSLIVYPARFQRVLAACGVMANGNPYNSLGGPMEGNVGPPSKMATAMSAYTPNIPWLRIGCPHVADMDGAGTSSATPQLAAAAALWLAKNGTRFQTRDWRRVEAVRAALFGTAERSATGAAPDPFFGQGKLRANDALAFIPGANLVPSDPASASFGFLHLLSSVFGMATVPDERRLQMYNVELTQLALASRSAREAVPDPDLPPDAIDARQRLRFLEAIVEERGMSVALRKHVEGLLGRGDVAVPREGTSDPGDGTWPAEVDDLPWQIARPAPARRRLRVFATDPGDSSRLLTAPVNLATLEVPWEDKLKPGPVGEYLEVVDIDPATDAAYDPVDLNEAHLLAQDGMAPSEGNPQFHQQMVYAVAMRTIRNFEIALGRRALWAERRMKTDGGAFVPAPDGGYVQRLRIYPHAMREKNAYYSPDRKALLFGYYADLGSSGGRRTIFTCLSHDIIAHETTHALLDGLHRRYQESSNPDVLAFHEAFADIVAIFQHFTLPELLRFEIGKQRGDLWQPSMLSDLARQFGQSLHNERALREAIDASEKPTDKTGRPVRLASYANTDDPHDRGAILVTAVFEAFVAIYSRRTEDLFRIATGGSGVLAAGAIHPDLVERLAQTAADTAQRVLTICIRALDYMPPLDPTFGDYLRAIVTADADVAPDRGVSYRVAFAEAFVRRGIYPPDISSISPDSLIWRTPDGPVQSDRFGDFIRSLDLGSYTQSDRREAFRSAQTNAARLHAWMADNLDEKMARSLGIDFRVKNGSGKPRFEVGSVRPAQRTTADGEPRTHVVVSVQQWRWIPFGPGGGRKSGSGFKFRGGSTLILDREYGASPVRYAIIRPVWSPRAEEMRDAMAAHESRGPNATYGRPEAQTTREPFAVLHRHLEPAGTVGVKENRDGA